MSRNYYPPQVEIFKAQVEQGFTVTGSEKWSDFGRAGSDFGVNEYEDTL